MKIKLLSFFGLFLFCSTLLAQQKPAEPIKKDSVVVVDSLNTTILYSKDSLDAPVDYGATDSMRFDLKENLVYLYGNAYVKYRELNLKADYIVIDMKNNTALAEPRRDTVKNRLIGIPQFDDGTQKFDAQKMKYNFKTRKGLIYDVTTKQNDIFIHGGKSKFVAGEASKDSTKKPNDIAYSSDAVFTTCNLEHPHFGIRSQKQKVIANKLIVVGPSNLTIGDVPTPLWLPFGFFPIAPGKRAGVIFPRDYQYSAALGFGFNGIGFYQPLNDNIDATLSTDVYFNGTFGVRLGTNYYKKYKYRGNATLGYRREIREGAKAEKTVTNSYNLNLNYNQDAKANPTVNYRAKIDFSTGNYNNLVYNDASRVLQSKVYSSASVTKTFPNRPFTLSASTDISQDFNTKITEINLPNVDVQMQRIFPFKRKERVGEERWYEGVTLTYNSSVRNNYIATDSTLFQQQMFDRGKFGIQHRLASDVQFTVFKYFKLTPSVNYSEFWYLKSTKKQFTDKIVTKNTVVYNQTKTDSTIRVDTVSYGTLDTAYQNGFQRVNQFSASINLTSNPIFGKINLSRKGKIRAIRHTISPNVGFVFSPDYTEYIDSTEIRDAQGRRRIGYNRYENTAFIPQTAQRQAALTYGFNNLFQLKYFQKKDSSEKRINLLDNIAVGGSYNFAADSFRFSPLSISTGTNLFRGMVQISANAQYSFYGVGDSGKVIKTLNYDINKKLLRFTNARVDLNTGLSVGQIKQFFKKKNATPQNNNKNAQKNIASELGLGNLFDGFSVQTGLELERQSTGILDTTYFRVKPLLLNGNIPLNLQVSGNWRVSGTIGYDFQNKQFTYPDISVSRDLHCWEMGLNWQPQRGTYGFFIRVKPGSFDFLKIPYNKYRVDATQ